MLELYKKHELQYLNKVHDYCTKGDIVSIYVVKRPQFAEIHSYSVTSQHEVSLVEIRNRLDLSK